VDVVFCVDNSGSIGEDNWPLMLDLVKSLVSKLNVGPEGTHVGLVDFGYEGYQEFHLGRFSTEQQVNAAVETIAFKGEGTYMSYGLETSRALLAGGAEGVRDGVPKLIVLITDGVPAGNDLEYADDEVFFVKEANIRLVTVGIGPEVNETFLKAAASTEADFAYATDFNSLSSIADLVVNADTCKPPPPLPTLPPRPDCKVNVVFCVDNSGSIAFDEFTPGANWKLVLNLIQTLVTILNVGPDGSHGGLVDFGYEGYPEFNLAKYHTDDEVNQAVASLTFRGEGTYMSEGLRYSREMLQDSSPGVRPGLPKLVVLITDGEPASNDKKDTEREVERVKEDNIRLVTIGVGSEVNETFLRSVASTPADYSYAKNFNRLSSIANMIVNEETCKSPPPLPSTPARPPPPTFSSPPTTTTFSTPPSTTPAPPKPTSDGKDCGDIRKKNPKSKSGLYWISIPGVTDPVHVYCDMTTDHEAWTVFQRRIDGSEDFKRNWETYEEGFGDLDGEFWLGNRNIAALTNSNDYRLRIDLGDFQGTHRFAEYNNFKIGPDSDKFRLTFCDDSYFGSAGDSLTVHSNMFFSTLDVDHDLSLDEDCASLSHGAWWYNACHQSNLNGQYNNTASGQGVNWSSWLGYEYSLRFSEMKIRSAY